MTRAHLDRILEQHKLWHDSDGEQGAWADLSGADLSRAFLIGADLSGANLNRADLSGANLNGVDLSGAFLIGGDLRGAELNRADLRGAFLMVADLRGAFLFETNLSGADLLSAELNDTVLHTTDLNGADLRSADLTDALFEPTEIPSRVKDVLRVRGLRTLGFEESPDALVRLRKLYRDAGMRHQEREVTCAINRSRFAGNGVGDWLNRIAFDWTCAYGLHSRRPLWILLGAMVVFGGAYMLALLRGKPRSGIRVAAPDHKPRRGCSSYGVLLTYHQQRGRRSIDESKGRLYRARAALARPWRAVRISLYFSLLMATRVGFRDINVGNWIARIQSREYVLYGTGWVRTVAGIQSLLSVYLLALWVLSYWSRPFDAT